MNQLFKVTIFISLLFFSCGLTGKSPSTRIEENRQESPKEVQYVVKEGIELQKEDILNLLTPSVKKNLGVKYEVFKVFSYEDKLGKQFLVFTENTIKGQIDEENKLVNNIKAFNLLQVNDSELKLLWTIRDFINEYEKSMWFWTKYLDLRDIDSDGYIEPIVVYGSQSQYGSGKFDEGRVKILTYYKGKKVAIRHQNSELDNGRSTQIDDCFFALPNFIKGEVYRKVLLLQDNGHALFNTETLKKIESSL